MNMRQSGYTHKHNPTPRISANQLAEYLSANPLRRKRILCEARYPAAIITTRYEDARNAINAHLIDGSGTATILDAALETMKRRGEKRDLTTWKRTNLKICSEAIHSFQQAEADLGLGKIQFRAPDLSKTKLKITGVTVSVALDGITERTDANGQKFVGGIVLVITKPAGKKSKDTMPDRCAATALLVYEIVESQLQDEEICDPKMCIAVDVYGGTVYRTKNQHKQLLQTLETSCGEIATMWPTIEPPSNYNGPPLQ